MPIVVTLDGPAGAGKSTMARQLADRLGFRYLDTGAMYRTLTLVALERGIGVDDGAALGELARTLDLRWGTDGGFRVGERDVGDAIREPRVSAAVSPVSVHAAVREVMVDLQRRLAADQNLVCEGRDMGSVVFPDAVLKIYLDAAPEQRARRRWKDLEEKGNAMPYDEVLALVLERDRIDGSREHGPLRRSDDQIHVDTTDRTPEAVLDELVTLVGNRIPDQEEPPR